MKNRKKKNNENEKKTKITTKDITFSSAKSLGTKGSFEESGLSTEETCGTSLAETFRSLPIEILAEKQERKWAQRDSKCKTV